jgi:hypothetical protein
MEQIAIVLPIHIQLAKQRHLWIVYVILDTTTSPFKHLKKCADHVLKIIIVKVKGKTK